MRLQSALKRRAAPGMLIVAIMAGALYLQVRVEAPLLRMPFRAGTVVLCQQGNLSPAGWTHSHSNALHALDLSCPDDGRETFVVAAAPGMVADVFTSAKRGDLKAGLGWGNHIKLAHRGDFYTLYAHLDKVLVTRGEQLNTGDVIGTMGDTGAAGNRHLHFSLHRGKADLPGVGPTAEFMIVASDLDRSEGFRRHSSQAFVGTGRSFVANAGHLYASENNGAEPFVDGQPGTGLATRINSSEKEIRALLMKATRQ